ncbi:MAG: UDP-N-acetylmuramoyl-L-alanyl-D-glutamate--2,6-diaminopimelate ligase [Candidatus Omnitrophota bacterium]
MKISKIFPHLKLDNRLNNLIIKDINDDSRLVKEGSLFFIRERKNFDIFSVLRSIESKTVVFVGDIKHKDMLESIIKYKPFIFVRNVEKEFLKAVNLFYEFKESGLKFIAITGTNGKTTTASLIYYLLKKMGKNPSLISTARYLVGRKEYKADYTTPDFLTLRKILKKAKDAGSNFIIMEVSSHAISQKRIEGIEFIRCVFTNLSQDHLDYHRTMNSYFNVKKKLFLDMEFPRSRKGRSRNEEAAALINTDDKMGKILFKELSNKLSYGITSKADFKADNIRFNKQGSCFDLVYAGRHYSVASKLYGRYNILNVLGSLGVVISLGFSLSKAVKLISGWTAPEGRLERVSKDIFVDYAHTPDALGKALDALRQSGYERIICVFGCGGDRDKGKRLIMGKVASKIADWTFITSDNPRSEEPLKICSQIEKGFLGKNYAVAADRKEAIKKAIKMLKENGPETCLVVAGKGHEDCQIIKGRKIPFKDSRVIKELLKISNT